MKLYCISENAEYDEALYVSTRGEAWKIVQDNLTSRRGRYQDTGRGHETPSPGTIMLEELDLAELPTNELVARAATGNSYVRRRRTIGEWEIVVAERAAWWDVTTRRTMTEQPFCKEKTA